MDNLTEYLQGGQVFTELDIYERYKNVCQYLF